MPIYEYFCSACDIRFEKIRKMSDAGTPLECPECKEPAPMVPSVANHSFSHTVVGGPRPQNTGVHAIDYSYDQVIGRDAEAKKRIVRDRYDYKQSVLRDNPGATGKDLAVTPDREYVVMKKEEKQAKQELKSLLTK